MKTYTGVGSRKTPREVLALMRALAGELARQGWTLRSGHAPGADQAFEIGAHGQAEIFLPWPGYEDKVLIQGARLERPDPEAYTIAREFHPNWAACSSGAKALHARNVHQILGRWLNDPSRFMICWTPGGNTTGGTGTAIRLAEHWGVETYNLALASHRGRVERMVEMARA